MIISTRRISNLESLRYNPECNWNCLCCARKMISLKNFLAILAVMPLGIYARDCTTNTNGNINTPLTITNPSDLSLFTNCTTITGDILIAPKFSGSFILNGVTHFNGSITMDENIWANDLLAIEMLDLLEINAIRLPQAWGLKSLNMMRLQSVQEMEFIQGAQEAIVDFGALERAGSVSIAGTWTNISFPSLESVSSLTIATDPTWKIGERAEPLEIQLPALREAGWTSIRGHVSRLETPLLEKVGVPNAPEPNGMEVLANYTDLAGVYLVSLRELYGGLLLDGHISGVNLNGMYETNATLTIRAASPMDIYSGLQDAGVIDLSGEFRTLNFEDIFTATSLSITSSSIIQCPSSLVEVYEKINYPREATFCSNGGASSNGNALDDTLDNDEDDDQGTSYSNFPSFEDYFNDDDDDDKPRSHGIPTPVLVLTPLIVGVTCCTVAWCCFGKCRTARRERQMQAQGNIGGGGGDAEPSIQQVPPAYIRDRYGNGQGANGFSNDLPPTYSVDTPTRERSRYF
ncbi:hypothetical protein BJX64DRAFT_261931 [Aspergillus heterothallicus]